MKIFRKDPDADSGLLSMPEARIAALYVLLASVWIIGSDTLLKNLVGDGGMAWFLHSTKGLNFVITTGVVLYLVLRRVYGGWRQSEQRRLTEARIASERFRKLSGRIQTLREEERTRISREVHDELGQHLTSIKIQLRLIEDRLANRDERSLNPLIDQLIEAEETIDESIRAVRRISTGLRPMALDHLGLATALSEEAAEFSRKTGIACSVAVTGTEDRLPAEVETTVFRIFQESLTNVARHAEAGHVEVECMLKDRGIILSIRDDGVGIDPAKLCNNTSLGLTGMRERATDVGGTIVFKALQEKGTEVILSIPLPNPAHAGETTESIHENSDR